MKKPGSSFHRLGAASVAAALASASVVIALGSGPAGTAPTSPAAGQILDFGLGSSGQLGTGGSVATNSSAVLAKLPAGTQVVSVASADLHSLAATSTGQVYAWGDNTYGELGDGGTTASLTPVLVNLPAGTVVTQVAAALDSSMALTSTGQVYTWGLDNAGQLGNGTTNTTANSTPALLTVPGNPTISSISAGYAQEMAVTSTGALYGWGYNNDGQLGIGSTTTTLTPTAVHLGANSVTQVSTGYETTLAVTTSGGALAWGLNNLGQLGIGSTTEETSPVAVDLPAGTSVTEVGAGGVFGAAVTTSGKILTWGDNSVGELGIGTNTGTNTTPTTAQLPAGASATALATGFEHTLALTSTGAVYAWGLDSNGELGNGTTTNATSPVLVPLPAGISISGLGADGYTDTTLLIAPAVTTATSVSATASGSDYGQATAFVATVGPSDGTGTVAFTSDGSAIPGCGAEALHLVGTKEQAVCSVSSLSIGTHSIAAAFSPGDSLYGSSSGSLAGGYAVTAVSGAIVAWGLNTTGQIGNGTTTNSAVPVATHLPTGVLASAVAVGTSHSLAVTTTGVVYAWGDNTYGELGNGGTTSSTTPVQVNLPAGVVAVAAAAGDGDSLALTSTGQVYAWGIGSSDELGNGTSGTANPTPVLVSLPTGTVATAISAGFAHDLALTSTGAIYAWGLNNVGELGNGTTTSTATPTLVHLPVGAVATALVAGYAHSLAVTSTGSVLAWGYNAEGELGNGTTTTSTTPVAVSLPAGTVVSGVGAGDEDSVALTSSGSLLSWGDNAFGELGDGNTTNSSTPVSVSLPAGVTVATAVADLADDLALTSTGAVIDWGNNAQGELGNGTTTNSSTPVTVQLPAGTSAQAIGGSELAQVGMAVVNQVTPTVTVTSGPNPSDAGQSVALVATVTPTDGTDTVAFSADGSATPIIGCGTVALQTSGGMGVATCDTSSLAPGKHSVTATTTGDPLYPAASGSLSGSQTVNNPSGVAVDWGLNNTGQLGNGSTANSRSPVVANLPAGTELTAVAAGTGDTLALTTNGQVYAWGDDTVGELGNGTTSSTPSTTPVLVDFPAGTVVTAVSAGFEDALALTSTGQVYAWGLDNVGQTGNGTTMASGGVSTPTLVTLPAATVISAISSGYAHNVALSSTGQVYGWGYDQFGQLGTGITATAEATPVLAALPAGTSATAVSAGYAHTLAVTSAGTVLAWGDNTDGELGIGTSGSTPVKTPTAVTLPAGTTVTEVSAGYLDSMAVTSAGAVLSWGDNSDGELGQGTSGAAVLTPAPVALPSGTEVTTVSAELASGVALTTAGTMLSWGDNTYGELGSGATASSTSPVRVALPNGTAASAIGGGPYSASAAAVVSTATTMLALTAAPNPATVGKAVAFTATVTPSDGLGTVAFYADGSSTAIAGCGAVALELVAGQYEAVCSDSTLAVGTHAIAATYSGDSIYQGSSATLSGGETILPPVTVGPSTLPTPEYGQAYSTSFSAQGGTGAPYTFSVTAGSLPSGLSLANNGTLSGTPSQGSQTVTFTVTASDSLGDTGSATYTVTVAQAPQSIMFVDHPPAAVPYGSTFALSATATSGLPVTFTAAAMSVCTVSGSTVTFTGVGTCTIDANQAGNANYLPAPQVTQGFTVVKAATTLVAMPYNGTFSATLKRTFDGAPIPGQTVSFTFAGTPMCTATTNAQGVASCRSTALITIFILLGDYSYTATYAGNADYDGSTASAKL
jgi:alpha-tubulin suppressor-like RCC1 family protein